MRLTFEDGKTLKIERLEDLAESSEYLKQLILDLEQGFVNDYSKPRWTFRFEVTVHADTEAEAIRLGKIDCAFENGTVQTIPQEK